MTRRSRRLLLLAVPTEASPSARTSRTSTIFAKTALRCSSTTCWSTRLKTVRAAYARTALRPGARTQETWSSVPMEAMLTWALGNPVTSWMDAKRKIGNLHKIIIWWLRALRYYIFTLEKIHMIHSQIEENALLLLVMSLIVFYPT